MNEHAKRRTEAFAKFDELYSTLNGVEVVFRDKDGFLLKVSAPSIVYLLSYIDVVIEKIESIGFSCLDQPLIQIIALHNYHSLLIHKSDIIKNSDQGK